MEIRQQEVRRDPITGSIRHIEQEEHIPSEAEVSGYRHDRTNAVVNTVLGVVETLLAFRVLFLLFGARDVGFASAIYALTSPLVAPFKGIFSSPGVETGFLETAGILALIVYPLIAWGINSLINNRRQTPEFNL